MSDKREFHVRTRVLDGGQQAYIDKYAPAHDGRASDQGSVPLSSVGSHHAFFHGSGSEHHYLE